VIRKEEMSMGHCGPIITLISVWGIYTELQKCMYQMAHGPCLSQSLNLFIFKEKQRQIQKAYDMHMYRVADKKKFLSDIGSCK
jgi:hypothetical protein